MHEDWDYMGCNKIPVQARGSYCHVGESERSDMKHTGQTKSLFMYNILTAGSVSWPFKVSY